MLTITKLAGEPGYACGRYRGPYLNCLTYKAAFEALLKLRMYVGPEFVDLCYAEAKEHKPEDE